MAASESDKDSDSGKMADGALTESSVSTEKCMYSAGPRKSKKRKKNKRKKTSSGEDSSYSKANEKIVMLLTTVKEQQKMIAQLQAKVVNLSSMLSNTEEGQEEEEYMPEDEHMQEDEEEQIQEDEDEQGEEMPEPVTHNEKCREGKGAAISTLNENFPTLPVVTHKQSTVVNNAKKPKAPNDVTKRKPPPITVYNSEAKDLIKKIRLVTHNDNFNINIINKNVSKIHTQQNNDYEKILNQLKMDKVKFFTYTPKEKKPITLIIRKLPLTYEVEDLNEALINSKIEVKIIKIIKTKVNWLIQVSNESNIDELKNIKYLLHCKVSIDNLKGSRIVQCKNCQRYNHSAFNCNMPYRCVKCGDSHEPGKCPIPPKELNNTIMTITNELTGVKTNRVGIPVKCVNCGLEGHTANAKVCQIRIDLISKRNIKYNRINTPVVKYAERRNNISYASLLKNAGNTNTAQKISDNDSFNNINRDCHEIFGKDLLTCFAKVADFNKTYTLLKTREEKTKAIFSLLLNLKINE